ncbi:uncharacterized protein CTRU02_204614 [Colletotrichum truncatum]|uniref:Uncharacterized protein n=1 Tax=Colletotrichum truncatum TaxID=5467 RepID=A0ACC3ZCM4_COLTU|nr:uncharacterized protein CTRU02_02844 [Colletotrichum truncatum]KAF6797802.1 hypothetical protein CTRU02_02844 [Colletotrichum truncatum]
MSALNISSLLQTEQPVNHEDEGHRLLEDVFQQYQRKIPVKSKEEAVLSYYCNLVIHATKCSGYFAEQLTDEKSLQSTGYTIVDQAYCSRTHGVGILELARDQRKTLRQLKEVACKAVKDMQDIMQQLSPVERSPEEPTRHHAPTESSSRSSISTSTGMGVFSAVASQSSIATSHAYSDRRSMSPGSPQYDDVVDEMRDDEDYDNVGDNDTNDDVKDGPRGWNMDTLKHRGKGTYQCPHWRTCQKGGQNPNGGPKIFSRNCMFRQHLQKHSKPHKCRLPGCPNKEGFARKDQLVRHQQNVKHDQPYPIPMSRR